MCLVGLAGTDITNYIEPFYSYTETDLRELLSSYRIGQLAESETIAAEEQSRAAHLWAMGELLYATSIKPSVVALDDEYLGYREWSTREDMVRR